MKTTTKNKRISVQLVYQITVMMSWRIVMRLIFRLCLQLINISFCNGTDKTDIVICKHRRSCANVMLIDH